jgi:hypothetical protein
MAEMLPGGGAGRVATVGGLPPGFAGAWPVLPRATAWAPFAFCDAGCEACALGAADTGCEGTGRGTVCPVAC